MSRLPASPTQRRSSRGAYLPRRLPAATIAIPTPRTAARPYAGGRALTTEFGTITTPNITPDKATGIGGWSLDDFIRAMRWGIAPDGTHYVTAFPFPYFGRLTDSDLADLKAYLDSLAPVSRFDLGRANSLALLARARDAIGTTLATNFSPPAPASKDPQIARGAYLVATVGRCGDCHTPRTWLGVPAWSLELAGSKDAIASKRAPNITPDKTGIGDWSIDDIVTALETGGTPDFDVLGGSMGEIVRNTARLTDDDRRAIAVYLKSVPPKRFDKNN